MKTYQGGWGRGHQGKLKVFKMGGMGVTSGDLEVFKVGGMGVTSGDVKMYQGGCDRCHQRLCEDVSKWV